MTESIAWLAFGVSGWAVAGWLLFTRAPAYVTKEWKDAAGAWKEAYDEAWDATLRRSFSPENTTDTDPHAHPLNRSLFLDRPAKRPEDYR